MVDMAQSLKMFQETTFTQLAEIRDTQEAFKKELKQIAEHTIQSNSDISKSFDTLQTNINNFSTEIKSSIASLSSFTTPSTATSPFSEPPGISTSPPSLENPMTGSLSNNPPDSHQNETSIPPLSLPQECASMIPPPSRIVSDPSVSSKPPHSSCPPPYPNRIPTSKRNKVLFIADSIGTNVDIRHLEEATNTLIYTERAYGASYKPDAFKPHENFTSLSLNAPLKRNYSYAILQGSSTDITNLNSSSNLSFLLQEVTIASKNMITAARNILLKNPNIKKVIILDRIPRFDPPTTDPNGLKPKLSERANEILREELYKSDMKDKIVIEKHFLPKQVQQNLYGNPHHHSFDGIHLRGPDGRNHYTRSLCNILQGAMPIHSREPHRHVIPRISLSGQVSSLSLSSNTPKTSKPHQQVRNPDHIIINIEPENVINHEYNHYTIPTYNSFSVLGN